MIFSVFVVLTKHHMSGNAWSPVMFAVNYHHVSTTFNKESSAEKCPLNIWQKIYLSMSSSVLWQLSSQLIFSRYMSYIRCSPWTKTLTQFFSNINIVIFTDIYWQIQCGIWIWTLWEGDLGLLVQEVDYSFSSHFVDVDTIDLCRFLLLPSWIEMFLFFDTFVKMWFDWCRGNTLNADLKLFVKFTVNPISVEQIYWWTLHSAE